MREGSGGKDFKWPTCEKGWKDGIGGGGNGDALDGVISGGGGGEGEGD